MANLDKFVMDKLRIPSGSLSQSDIESIRRVRSANKSKIQHEVLVAFASVEARDLVLSHAKNLAEWTGKQGDKPLAGVRLEIPDRLRGDFKTLEQYGHALKTKHKDGLKRHIKLDDISKCLYMDTFVPKLKEWIRVDVDMAKKDNEARQKKKNLMTEERISQLSTASGTEDV